MTLTAFTLKLYFSKAHSVRKCMIGNTFFFLGTDSLMQIIVIVITRFLIHPIAYNN